MPDPQLKPGYTMRPAVPEDAQAVFELCSAVTMAMVNELDDTLDDIKMKWGQSSFNITTNTRVVIDPDGKFAGYAIVADAINPSTPFVLVYLHPDLWEVDDTIEPVLMAWVESRVLENASRIPDENRIAIRLFAHGTAGRYHDMVTRTGFEPIRHSFRMVIDLDSQPEVTPMPQGFTLHSSEPDEDWLPIIHAFREIWRDHWGYVERPFEVDHENWKTFREKNYRPGYWLLAMDGDTIAGMSINLPHHNGDETSGYVSTVGVKRNYRRKGLALALLQRSFAQLYADGKKSAFLHVDASSLTGATRLYEAAGMHADQTNTLFEKVLRPGIDPSTQRLEEEQKQE